MLCPPRSLDAALVMARPAAREAVVGLTTRPGGLAPVLSTLTMMVRPSARSGAARPAGAAHGGEPGSRLDVRRQPDPGGDRVIVMLDGKFLPYQW